jgi:dihydrofolate reductase
MKKISIIVAVDEKNGIGKGGQMPWNIQGDLKHFKDITSGHSVIMGRKTFDSIGRPLPERTNIIITRDLAFKAEGIIAVSSLEEAIKEAENQPGSEEIFIIGGGQVFNQAMDLVNKLYITLVKGVFDVDTVFPDYSMFNKKISQQDGESNGLKYSFLELEK